MEESSSFIPFPSDPNSSSSSGTCPPRTTRASPALEAAIEHELKHGRCKIDPNMDPKKIRRTISNRLSAQRSRLKKHQYIIDMEKTAKELEDCVSTLGPQVESHQEKNNILLYENETLQQHLELLTTESRLREMEVEQKRGEIERLKELKNATEDASLSSSREAQQIRNPINEQLIVQPYPSLSFYEFGLLHLQNAGSSSTGHFTALRTAANYHEFEQFSYSYQINPAVGVSAASGSISQEEVDIDQYLNLEALNVHPSLSNG